MVVGPEVMEELVNHISSLERSERLIKRTTPVAIVLRKLGYNIVGVGSIRDILQRVKLRSVLGDKELPRRL